MFKKTLTVLSIFLSLACTSAETEQTTNTAVTQSKILCGAEQTELYLNKLDGKNIGVVANHTSMIGSTHLVDTLLAHDIKVNAIYAPEHGFRGKADAGEHIQDGKDPKTGIPVFSLYGKNKKPSADMLTEIDLIIFDIQDVGARFYTYISTMHYVMEACAENGISVLILDRPNPNGHVIDGPVLDTAYSSFVGMHPVPIAHGMTIAEYARMVNEEGWLKNGISCELEYIPCKNYSHDMEYSLPVKPSPNLPNDRSIELYPSICLFEASTLSVGRGTNMQFQIIGHPDLQGVSTFSFTPSPNEGSKYPKHDGIECFGYDLRKENSDFPETRGKINLTYLLRIYTDFPSKDNFFKSPGFFDKLAGGRSLREQIEAGVPESDIRASWEADLTAFKAMRKKYLIYE